jgi:hypothetical protein
MSNKNNTFWNKKYIKNCPVRYSSDCFSVGYSFYFIKELTILPKFHYEVGSQCKSFQLSTIKTKVNGFVNINFGPVNELYQQENDIVKKMHIEIIVLKDDNHNQGININEQLVFKTTYIVPDYAEYTFDPQIQQKPLEYSFIVSSCYSLPGYRKPVTIKTYEKLAEVCKEKNPNQIIISGDIVYMEPISLTSDLSVQAAYNQLKEFTPIQDIWSEHTIKTGLDDHDLGFNDTYGNNTNVNLFRKKAQENFPLELEKEEYRIGGYTVKDITFIFGDDISNKKTNQYYNGIGYNKFESQLGQEQIEIIKGRLSNAWDAFGTKALIFIVLGKSMFGSINDTFVFCPQERDQIFSHIKYLGLRNVFFICGDSHQSDLSEFVIDKYSNQTIREIRNSAIGSKPRNDPNDNPYQVPGSFIGGKNVFGFIKLNQIGFGIYKIFYEVYDENGSIYNYEWNTDYK